MLAPEGEVVADALSRVETIAGDIRAKRWTGYSGAPITSVVHIGIGGSFLGPEMVSTALENVRRPGTGLHFVANVDGHHIDGVLKQLNPRSTLFVIASKTFTTRETMLNAETARNWLLEEMDEDSLGNHLIAVTANEEAASEFGIRQDNVLPMWDWVGGRFSLWSAVGVSIAIAYGFKTFRGC
ncbi:MAG: hypothetical protein U5O39_02700 [Gammaproteobacteria bacterium]|nr:hypothetical protein [Gammaproteobacteria bacterium]